jgi:hypothetical protein
MRTHFDDTKTPADSNKHEHTHKTRLLHTPTRICINIRTHVTNHTNAFKNVPNHSLLNQTHAHAYTHTNDNGTIAHINTLTHTQ